MSKTLSAEKKEAEEETQLTFQEKGKKVPKPAQMLLLLDSLDVLCSYDTGILGK